MYYRCKNCGGASERKPTTAAIGPCEQCKCLTLVRAERARIITNREVYRSEGGLYLLSKDKKKFYFYQ